MRDTRDEPGTDLSETCLSCEAPLDGPYCSQCGLKQEGRITVRGTLGALGHHVTSLDSTLWRTLRDLYADPAGLVRRYLAGDRRWILPPAKLAFLAATVYTIVTALLDADVRPFGARVDDPRAVQTMKTILSLVGYLLFAYLLPTAAALRWVFRTPRLLFAEAYVVLLFWMSQYLPVMALLTALGIHAVAWGYWAVRALGWFLLAFIVRGFFRTSTLKAVLGSLVVFLVSQVFAVVSGLVVMVTLVAVRGWGA